MEEQDSTAKLSHLSSYTDDGLESIPIYPPPPDSPVQGTALSIPRFTKVTDPDPDSDTEPAQLRSPRLVQQKEILEDKLKPSDSTSDNVLDQANADSPTAPVAKTIEATPRSQIEPHDSFTDLGSLNEDGEALKEAKESLVQANDVYQSQTFAELQTRVTSSEQATVDKKGEIGTPDLSSTGSKTSEEGLGDHAQRTSISSGSSLGVLDLAPLDMVNESTGLSPPPPGPRISMYDPKLLARDSVYSEEEPIPDDSAPGPVIVPRSLSFASQSSVSSQEREVYIPVQKPQANAQLESLLLSTSKVSQVCVLVPKAGPFENQIVALFTTPANPYAQTHTDEICLPSPSETENCRRQIQSLRTALQEWGSGDEPKVSMWIVLAGMAVDAEGKPDIRKLQTWVQNINSEAEEHILRLQFISEPRKSVLAMKKARRSPQVPKKGEGLPERLSKVWEEEEKADLALAEDHTEKETQNLELFPLSPMQQLHFRTSMSKGQKVTSMSNPGFRFTQSILIRLQGGVQLTDVEAAIESLTTRHSMLRARFRLTKQGWAQVIVPPSPSSYRFGHHSADDDMEVLSLLDLAQSSINVVDGPVFAAEYIRTNDGRQLLQLAAHNLVVDLKSWSVLLHDLDSLLRTGNLLSKKSIPFTNWVDQITYEASQRSLEPVLPFEIPPADLEFWGMQNQSNTQQDADSMGFYLAPDLTDILQTTCNAVFRTESEDIFLAALLLSFCQVFPERSAPVMWKQEVGRETSNVDFNLQETVGWFTTLCPIRCDIDSTKDFIDVLKMIKDTRRSIPTAGIPLLATQLSMSSRGAFKMLPLEVMFSCVSGSQDVHKKGGALEPIAAPNKATSAIVSEAGPNIGRMGLLEISVIMNLTGTNVEAQYNRNMKHDDRIATWMGIFEHMVLEAIGRLRVMEPELTLADVPHLKATYDGMKALTEDRLVTLGLDNISGIETIYPASPAQQEILIARGQNVDSFQVHSIYELIVPGSFPADQAKLCSAWESLVAAHPMLRSIFIDSVSESGLFDQVVFNKISPAMLFLDSDDPEVTLASLPSMRLLAVQPRHRLSVCRNEDRTFVRIDASQTICDSVSIHNLMDQLRRAYAGHSPSVNPEILPTYLSNIASNDMAYSLSVWKLLLDGVKPCAFPRLTVEPRPGLESTSFGLDVSRSQILDYCKERNLHPSLVLQLAWGLVLRAFLGTDKVTFGYQMQGRDENLIHGISESVGSFATILPCSVNLSPGVSLRSALSDLKALSTQAKQHSLVTMPVLQDTLEIAGEDLFNTCLSFTDITSARKSSDGIETSLVTTARTSNCDVSLSSTFINDALHVNISFRHMTSTQAHSLISTFERAIRAVLESPNKIRVSEVDLVTDRDYALLTVQDWEPGQGNQEVRKRIDKIIVEYARANPNDIAVCSWDGELTYRQLSQHAQKIATLLINHGAEPGQAIPIVLEKNKWAPVIMLGVLQAGCCFIPLDCQDKLMVEALIKQLDPEIVLATNAAWKVVSILSLQPILINDTFFGSAPQLSTPMQEAGPDHGACVFFTPGTTKSGHSKSIFFTHSSLATTFTVQGPALKMNADSRVLQLSAFGIDIALVETLGTLFHGGCVCIPSAVERMQDLAGAIDRTGATWSYMTAVLARRLDPAKVPTLQTLCFRTRSLDEDTYGPWLKGRHILLAYGAPDVCPLGVSITEVTGNWESTIIPPPIMGRFWIIDPIDPRKPVPVGAIGELGIDSPLITPHRFTPNEPQIALRRAILEGRRPGHLRTGHRVRCLDDGNVQFLSSMRDEIVMGDSPVAVADLELRIRRAIGPGIDTSVEAVTTNDGVHVFVAFLEYGEKNFIGPSDFDELSSAMRERAFLAKKAAEDALRPTKNGKSIPHQHIPSIFIPIKRFPISSSLKVNKRRLQKMVSGLSYTQLLDLSNVPNPGEVLHKARKEKPLPLTQVEEAMRQIWATVLDIAAADISSTDDFLKVGGTKHKACQLVVECRQAGLVVSILDVIRGATLTELCQTIAAADADMTNFKRASKDGRRSSTPAKLSTYGDKFIRQIVAPQLHVGPQDILDVTEASPSQIRNLEMGMWAGRGHVSCLVLSFNGPLRHQRLQVACEALSRTHPILRTAFIVHNRKAYQVLVDSFKPGFERYPCPAGRLDGVCEHVTNQEQNLPFSLAEPVTKFSFFDGPYQSKLVIRLSTAQLDEPSVKTLVNDLILLYSDPKSVPKKSTFFDYQRAVASNVKNSTQYWKLQLDRANPTLIVGHGRPYPPVPTSKIGSLTETVQVNPLNDYDLTFESVLKAAWGLVLATISASPDVLFGEVVNGRRGITRADGTSPDMSAVVGPTGNMIPVRIVFPATHSTPLDLVTSVRNQRRASQPHDAFGFLDIIQNCTKWSYWTRFSSVIEHKAKPTLDVQHTMNIGTTTFTYSVMDPICIDMPDVFISSVMNSSRRATIKLSYPSERVNHTLAQHMLSLLTKSIATLTNYDTMTRQIISPASSFQTLTARVPLPPPIYRDTNNSQANFGDLLSADQRAIMQPVITRVWSGVLDPSVLGVPDAQTHKAAFYDLWGSLLTAHYIAQALNRQIQDPMLQVQLKIPGATMEQIRLTAGDIVTAPTMQSQFELLSRRLREAGYIPPSPTRKKGHSHSLSASAVGTTPWTQTGMPESNNRGSSSGSGGLSWTRSFRKKSKDANPGWIKHKRGGSNPDGLQSIREDASTPTSSSGGNGFKRLSRELVRRSTSMRNSSSQPSPLRQENDGAVKLQNQEQDRNSRLSMGPPIGIAELPPQTVPRPVAQPPKDLPPLKQTSPPTDEAPTSRKRDSKEVSPLRPLPKVSADTHEPSPRSPPYTKYYSDDSGEESDDSVSIISHDKQAIAISLPGNAEQPAVERTSFSSNIVAVPMDIKPPVPVRSIRRTNSSTAQRPTRDSIIAEAQTLETSTLTLSSSEEEEEEEEDDEPIVYGEGVMFSDVPATASGSTFLSDSSRSTSPSHRISTATLTPSLIAPSIRRSQSHNRGSVASSMIPATLRHSRSQSDSHNNRESMISIASTFGGPTAANIAIQMPVSRPAPFKMVSVSSNGSGKKSRQGSGDTAAALSGTVSTGENADGIEGQGLAPPPPPPKESWVGKSMLDI